MQGLRTQENSEFNKFFKLVQSEAQKQGKVFFLDCEEGNDSNIDGMEVCNLSGWLIPGKKASEFESVWEKEEEDDNWSDFFCFVRWNNDNGLRVSFE